MASAKQLGIPPFTSIITLAEYARSVDRVHDSPSPGLLLIIQEIQLH